MRAIPLPSVDLETYEGKATAVLGYSERGVDAHMRRFSREGHTATVAVLRSSNGDAYGALLPHVGSLLQAASRFQAITENDACRLTHEQAMAVQQLADSASLDTVLAAIQS